MRTRRTPGQDVAGLHVLTYSALSAKCGSVTDLDVADETGLPSDSAVIAKHRRTGNTGLSNDDTVFAYSHVVRDLDKVINLRAFTDSRFTHCCAINRRIRSDFDVVFDHDNAHLRYLAIMSAVKCEAEPIRSDYRTGMNNHSVTKFDVMPDRCIRMQVAIVAYYRAFADKDLRLEYRAIANSRTAFDDTVGADRHSLTDFRIGRNHGARMNARRRSSRWMKMFESGHKRGIRIIDFDNVSALTSDSPAHEHYAGLRRFELRDVFDVRKKRRATCVRSIKRRNGDNFAPRIPGQLAADKFGKLLSRHNGHNYSFFNSSRTISVISYCGRAKTMFPPAASKTMSYPSCWLTFSITWLIFSRIGRDNSRFFV